MSSSRRSGSAERLYRLLLRAYPPDFRDRMADEMLEAFSDQVRDARRCGPGSVAWLWVRVIRDVVNNGLAERLRSSGAGRRDPASTRRRPPMGRRSRLSHRSLLEASRQLRRSPGLALVAVLTIAVGIGAFASIYAAVDNVLLESMPYEEPDELVYLWRDYPWMNFPRGWVGGVDVLALRERATVFEGIVAIRSGSVNLEGGEGRDPAEIRIMLVSPGFFDLLGVQPALGRGFVPGEEEVGASTVAVLGHALWRQRYGEDPEIVGRDVRMDGEPVRVVGVAPPGFRFAQHSSLGSSVTADAYVPLQMDLSQIVGGAMAAVARLREGVTPERVQAELDTIIEPIDQEVFEGLGLRLYAVGLQEDLVGEVRPVLTALTGAAGLMLLILGANLATLLLVRSVRRTPELAVRATLGADGGSLFRETLLEGLLLGVAGGAFGLLFGAWGSRFLIALSPEELPRQDAIALDGSVAAVALACGVILGLLAALVPAVRAARIRLGDALRTASVRGGGAAAQAGRRSLVVAQVALSLVLLVSAGVLARSFVGLLGADPGFDPTGVLTLRVPLAVQDDTEPAEVVATYERVRERLAALHGVTAVGGSTALPLTEETSQAGVSFPNSPTNTGDSQQDGLLVDRFAATPGYFEALRVRLLAGRTFRDSDGAEDPLVAVIDEAVARRFFPNGDPLGQTMDFMGATRTVVGVVEQPRLYDVHRDDRGQVWLPVAQRPSGSLSFAVRSGREPLSLAGEARAAVREVDPDLPVTDVRTMESIVDASLSEERLSLTLIAGFALGALLLAALGLYGVVSATVARRTREMGVRMALGASPRSLLSMVLGQGMRLTAAGLVVGALAALAATRLLEGLVVGIEPTDPWTLTGVAVALMLVALAATAVPAVRATRIDPMEALRTE